MLIILLVTILYETPYSVDKKLVISLWEVELFYSIPPIEKLSKKFEMLWIFESELSRRIENRE